MKKKATKKKKRKTYTLKLFPDVREPINVLPQNSTPMESCLDAPKRPGTDIHLVQRKDRMKVEVEIRGRKKDLRHYRAHSMRILSSPAPGSSNQFFTAAFRRGNDFPDGYIMASAQAKFEKKKDGVFVMRFPRRLPFLRPGNFSLIYYLTLEDERDGRLRNFVDDPEIDVEGSYP